jgi:hypothetical protein
VKRDRCHTTPSPSNNQRPGGPTVNRDHLISGARGFELFGSHLHVKSFIEGIFIASDDTSREVSFDVNFLSFFFELLAYYLLATHSVLASA